MTLNEKIDAALQRAAALEKLYMSAPNERDLTTERQREAVQPFRSLAIQRRGNMLNAVNQINRVQPRYDEHKKWLDVLLTFEEKANTELAEMEKTPAAERSDADYRNMDALRDAMKQTQRGVEWYGSMCMIAPPLMDYLRAAGYTGNPFAGRGSIVSTEERVEVFGRAIAAVEEQIDRELATPLPTLEMPAAVA